MNLGKPIRIEAEDVLPHPATSSSQFTTIIINSKSYDFSPEMLQKYPKLLDPAARYTLGFDSLLPLFYDYPASCICPTLLDEPHEKTLFLSNCEFFGIVLSPDVILRLNTETKKELQECSDYITRSTGRKGANKMRFSLKKDVRLFCREHEAAHSELYHDIKPLEIVEMLEEGVIDALTLHDWRSKNAVKSFTKLFLEKFLAR
jgi:hypothetical protein